MAGEIPGTRHLATVGLPTGPALKNQFSQVEDFVRFPYHPNVQIGLVGHQYYKIGLLNIFIYLRNTTL